METWDLRREPVKRQSQLLEKRQKEGHADKHRTKEVGLDKPAKASMNLEDMMPAERREYLARMTGISTKKNDERSRKKSASSKEERWNPKKENLVVTVQQGSNVKSRLGNRRDVKTSNREMREPLVRLPKSPATPERSDGDIFQNVARLSSSEKAAMLAQADRGDEYDGAIFQSTSDLSPMSKAQIIAQAAPKDDAAKDTYEADISKTMQNMTFVPYMGDAPTQPSADFPTGTAYLPPTQPYGAQVAYNYAPTVKSFPSNVAPDYMGSASIEASLPPTFRGQHTNAYESPEQISNLVNTSLMTQFPGSSPGLNQNFLQQNALKSISPPSYPQYPNSVSPSFNTSFMQGSANQSTVQPAFNSSFMQGATHQTSLNQSYAQDSNTQRGLNSAYMQGVPSQSSGLPALSASYMQNSSHETTAQSLSSSFMQGTSHQHTFQPGLNSSYMQGSSYQTTVQPSQNPSYMQGSSSQSNVQPDLSPSYMQGNLNQITSQPGINPSYMPASLQQASIQPNSSYMKGSANQATAQNPSYMQAPVTQPARRPSPALSYTSSASSSGLQNHLRCISPAIAGTSSGLDYLSDIDFSVPPPPIGVVPNIAPYRALREAPQLDVGSAYQENRMYKTPPHAQYVPGNATYDDVISPDQANVSGISPYVPTSRHEPIDGSHMPQSQADMLAQAMAMAGGANFQYQNNYDPKPARMRPLLGRSDGDQTQPQQKPEYGRMGPPQDTNRRTAPVRQREMIRARDVTSTPINNWESSDSTSSDVRNEAAQAWGDMSSDDGRVSDAPSEAAQKWDERGAINKWDSYASQPEARPSETTSEASESNESAKESSISTDAPSTRWEDLLEEDSPPAAKPAKSEKPPKQAKPAEPHRRSKLYERMERARNDDSKRHSRSHRMNQMRATSATWELTFQGKTMTVNDNTSAAEIRAIVSSATNE